MARVSRKRNINTIIEPTDDRYRVGIYIRLSYEDERKIKSESVNTQEKIILEHLENLSIGEIYKIYKDINYSGTNFKRPAFEEMIEDAKQNRINCVIVKDLSRFGRNYLETGQYLENFFPFLNIRFISVIDKYDSIINKDVHDLIIPLKNLMNEIYARDISRKVSSSLKQKRESGVYCGSYGPYGYIKQGTTLIIDTEVAPIVCEIFRIFLSGVGIKGITQSLNRKGYFTPNRYRYEKGIIKNPKYAELRLWNNHTVRSIIDNPVYTGKIVSGNYIRRKFEYCHKSEILEFEDKHEAIISKKDFEQARKIRKSRTDYYNSNQSKEKNELSRENILVSKVICSECEKSMRRVKVVLVSKQVLYRYACRTFEDISKENCFKRFVKEENILHAICATLNSQFQLFAEIKDILENANRKKKFNSLRIKQQNAISRIQKRIIKIEELESDLYADYVGKILTSDEYLLLKEKYIYETEELSEVLKQTIISAEKSQNITFENIPALQTMDDFHLSYQALTSEIIDALVERVEIDRLQTITVVLKYKNQIEELYQNLILKESREDSVENELA